MRKTSLFLLSLVLSTSTFAITNNQELFIKNSINNLKEFVLKTKQNNFIGKTYSVDEIYTDYTNNELTANKKYKDKDLRIKTTINQIKEDVFGNAFIIATIKDSIIGSAHFKVNEKDPRILELSKNNSVDLVCRFDEYSLDSLSFNQCLFTDQFVDKLLNPLKERLLKFGDVGYKPKSKTEVGLSGLPYIFTDEILNKVCEKDPKNCSMDNIGKSKYFDKKKMQNVDFEKYQAKFIQKYGKEWFDSLPKFPTVE
ncbi:OB-fold protein [Rodentibacter pneumotropicus]|uniref:OB-fold protein n=1 Tax=Rodentibacter pneumotropicus TaxID=758 RepID=UPI00109C83CF|nr:hypothetical protein [Rodentibacter pneumotropicus]THA14565.1 hypothetical protein D3M82_07530 [Rodentibacter pneumotropicus]